MSDSILGEDGLVEVASGTVTTYDGEAVEVVGGAYLSPENVLRATTELQRLRQRARESDELPRVLPVLLVTAGFVGAAIGFWLGRRTIDDE